MIHAYKWVMGIDKIEKRLKIFKMSSYELLQNKLFFRMSNVVGSVRGSRLSPPGTETLRLEVLCSGLILDTDFN